MPDKANENMFKNSVVNSQFEQTLASREYRDLNAQQDPTGQKQIFAYMDAIPISSGVQAELLICSS